MKTKTRVILTVAVVLSWLVVGAVFDTAQGPIQGGVAVAQLNGGNAEYTAARTVATTEAIPTMGSIVGITLLLLLWIGPLVRGLKGAASTDAARLVTLGFVASLLIACGPPKLEMIEEISPSETAFMIQLEGDALEGQDVFKSVEFLNEHKVATKRVSLPQRKVGTGRGWWNYKYLPTAAVIKVDRKPVTREWTEIGEKATSTNQVIHVESKDSIGFGLGVNATASIPEDMASTYLYHFAGKPLAKVMDENVRGFLQTVLSREFGDYELSQGRELKREIFTTALKETREYFVQRGLSIDYLGSSEGLTYENAAIQLAIDAVFNAQRDVEKAKEEKLAQDERNMLIVAKAKAEREAAQEFALAKEAAIARTRLEIDRIHADAALVAANKWQGGVPGGVVPSDSPFLFNFGGGVSPQK